MQRNQHACSTVHLRLDYCNSLLHRALKSHWIDFNWYKINWYMLSVTSAPIRTIPLTFFENYTFCQSAVKSLLRLAFCALWHEQPTYLHAVLYPYVTTHNLWSSEEGLLEVPWTKTKTGALRFSVVAPTIWHTLPSLICDSSGTSMFKFHLKPQLFSRDFGTKRLLEKTDC